MKYPLELFVSKRLTHMAPLLAGAMLVSCSNSHTPHPPSGRLTASITPVNQRNWVKVSSRPPVWYPRGVPSDAQTDFRSGEWVYTGDVAGTRFFIPFKGVPKSKRQALREEALALRSENKRNEINNEGKRNVKAAAATVALIPVAIALSPLVFAGMIYTPWYFHRESENPALQR